MPESPTEITAAPIRRAALVEKLWRSAVAKNSPSAPYLCDNIDGMQRCILDAQKFGNALDEIISLY